MIQIFKTFDGQLMELEEFQEGAWMHLTDPEEEEIRCVASQLGLEEDYLRAALDEEESPRIETDEGQTLVIVDMPVVQAEGRTVTIRQDGRDRLIALSAEDDSILDAALRQGADLPFACKGGVCATCKCKVLRGEVAMAANYSLEADELAAGYVLSCQSLPTSGDVVVDFDARGMA